MIRSFQRAVHKAGYIYIYMIQISQIYNGTDFFPLKREKRYARINRKMQQLLCHIMLSTKTFPGVACSAVVLFLVFI